MAKFGRFFWNNNDFINVFYNFVIYQNSILITEIQLYYQLCHDLCKFRHIHSYMILLGAGLGLYLCPLSQSALGITAALFSRPIDSRPVVQNDKETKADSNEK